MWANVTQRIKNRIFRIYICLRRRASHIRHGHKIKIKYYNNKIYFARARRCVCATRIIIILYCRRRRVNGVRRRAHEHVRAHAPRLFLGELRSPYLRSGKTSEIQF